MSQMKKVARLRIAQQDVSSTAAEPVLRTTGRIKKPKAVFDPSDNYLPRAARLSNTNAAAASTSNASTSLAAGGSGSPVERRSDTPETVTSTQPQKQEQRLSSRSSGSGGSISNTPSITSTTTIAFPAVGIAGGISSNCFVCHKNESKRSRNKLVSCVECGKRIHKQCLDADFEDLETLRQNYKCSNCRSCDVCNAFTDTEPKYDVNLVTCTKCVKSYHFTCHIPNVPPFQQHQTDWKCNKCSSTSYAGMVRSGSSSMDVKAIHEIMGVVQPPARVAQSLSPQQQNVSIAAAAAEAKSAAAASAAVKRNAKEQQKNVGGGTVSNGAIPKTTNKSEPKKARSDADAVAVAVADFPTATTSAAMRFSPNEPADVPDVKYWSVEQVAEYFARDFPEEAHVFRDQEIDGMSLLLLKRSDVIKKLPIKLGPSLRIYSLILKLQTQLNDPTLGWNCGL